MEIEVKRNNKRLVKRIVYLTLTLICMITIFMFSSENGEESQNRSDATFTNTIINNTMKVFPNSNRDKVENLAVLLVRKGAHFSLYAVLGFVLFGYINTYELKLRDKILLTIMLCMIYAISDEIHQLFVPERSGQIKDVFIDTLGASFSTWVGCLINKKGEKKIGRTRHKTNSSSNME